MLQPNAPGRQTEMQPNPQTRAKVWLRSDVTNSPVMDRIPQGGGKAELKASVLQTVLCPLGQPLRD